MRWNQALLRDELRVSSLLHTPGQLDDGTELDYAWAIDVRTLAGVAGTAGSRVYRHGGLWAGLSTQLARLPDQDSSFVIIALDHDEDRTTGLADALIHELTSPQS